MLAVPYFEKALYEMPEDQLTVDSLLALAADTETKIQGGPATRPIMSVPHILADEASCYYHVSTIGLIWCFDCSTMSVRSSGTNTSMSPHDTALCGLDMPPAQPRLLPHTCIHVVHCSLHPAFSVPY
jgi:hypothetical protein